MAHHSVESNSHTPKTKFLIGGTVLSCSTNKWAAPVPHTSEKNDCISFSEDYYSVFCYMQIFDGPLHTLALIGSTINFTRFYQTKQCKEEKIFLICTCAETGFRDTSLKGALPYRLLDRLKACNTNETL